MFFIFLLTFTSCCSKILVHGQEIVSDPVLKNNRLAIGYPKITFSTFLDLDNHSNCEWVYKEQKYKFVHLGKCNASYFKEENTCSSKKVNDVYRVTTSYSVYQPSNFTESVCVSCIGREFHLCSTFHVSNCTIEEAGVSVKTRIDPCGYNCVATLTCKDGYFAERKSVPVVCQIDATFNDSLRCFPAIYNKNIYVHPPIPKNCVVSGLSQLIVSAKFSLALGNYCNWEYDGSLDHKVFYSSKNGCTDWSDVKTKEFITCATIHENEELVINTSLKIFHAIESNFAPCIRCSIYNSSLCANTIYVQKEGKSQEITSTSTTRKISKASNKNSENIAPKMQLELLFILKTVFVYFFVLNFFAF